MYSPQHLKKKEGKSSYVLKSLFGVWTLVDSCQTAREFHMAIKWYRGCDIVTCVLLTLHYWRGPPSSQPVHIACKAALITETLQWFAPSPSLIVCCSTKALNTFLFFFFFFNFPESPPNQLNILSTFINCKESHFVLNCVNC